ncbi:Aspartic proteinase Asp1 [Zea mays]|uniref:Aspartic proteinase Asp1 n=5 Tax=Zea mays TaxID=4577 RepID=B7ZZY5_MAIZE|nr:aspartic proteinase Asp1 precursor [Zea mays]ACL53484.1 unknown [Zea mays]ACL54629.1 unknown [Zea mays]ONM19492.1 Aspartyl protease APCB1 [Zea mays]PWZ38810.1 Aspartic proteinase Asp1 [Zea mays]|eukprot:NP_001292779.1 aspartic proteinase Asp1 precursor [Zea mays]
MEVSRWTPAAGLLLLLLLPLAATPSRAATMARSPSSSTAVFQLQGDVYPTGHYYVTMNIGNPAKPYFLDVDTGSDLTWLQCDAPCRSCNKVPHPLYRPTANRLVPCANALCTALHSGQGSNNKCPSPKQCDYQIKYTDSASSQGVLINDSFSLPMRSSNIRPGLTFGCGYDQQVGKNGAVQAAIDGMLGLGRGSVSLVSQLKQQGITKNVVGHCLSTNGGGFLFFGDDVVPSSRVTWVPMAQRTSGNYYSPGSGTLYFDRRSLGVKPMEVVFDSGSTYTYFTAQPYQAVVSALKGGLSKSLKQVSDPTLPLCWKGQKAFKSVFDVKNEFKSMFLSFASAKNAAMEIPPENYLIVTKNGNVCLGILDGTAAKLSFNVIGDITMQDQMVIYDNEKSQLGWARGACTRSAKSILSSFP